MKQAAARVLALLLALLQAIASMPAIAADPYGYWSVATSPGQVKLGLVFPDFSPNEFAGVLFTCAPGQTGIDLVVDLPDPKPAGSTVEIVLSSPRDAARYRGRVEVLELDDRVVARAMTTVEDPVFEGIAAATALTLTAGGRKMGLPVRGADKATPRFLAACRG